MKLHIFNPEHDIALATHVSRFTPPHAARQLRADVGFLPALWASDGDLVLVDSVEAALYGVSKLRSLAADVLFVTLSDLQTMVRQDASFQTLEADPWGWDQGVAEQLAKAGLRHLIPADWQLEAIRRLSNRRWAAEHLLPLLRDRVPTTVGQSCYVSRLQPDLLRQQLPLVVKAPWSSSGRGVRYLMDERQLGHSLTWLRRVVERQGGIMVEPFYHKVADFGMEFQATPEGVDYCGLSLFNTENTAYTGSIIATETAKRAMLARYLPTDVLDDVCRCIAEVMQEALRDVYTGPFGVDMMVVASDGRLCLHPCVELNLRRTMGHVALSLPCDETLPQRLMTLQLTDKYRLRIRPTNENVINNSLV